MFEVRERAFNVVDLERAAHAALLPSGAVHEMFDDQLATSVEEIGERLFALRTIEQVILLDLDPRQRAPLGAQLIAQPREFFFLDQVLPARCEPLILGYDSVVLHGSISLVLR